MARQPRLCLPGLVHHVVQRGHSGQRVFVDDRDREAYLQALGEALRGQAVALLAYALLDDQVRLLLLPPEADALARALQSLGRRYVAAFNRRHGRSGTLWDGRFRAGVVQPGEPTLQCMLHIERLAIHAAADGAVDAGRWCSAPHRLGQVRDPLLGDAAEYWGLGNTPFDREAAYARRLEAGLDAATAVRIDEAALRGRAYGSANFVAQLARDTGRPLLPRPRGRPRRRDEQATGTAAR